MRILYWTELFWPHIGGVEVLGVQFLRALQKRNHECFVVTSHSGLKLPDKSEYSGIPIYRFHFQRALAHRDIKEMARAKDGLIALKQILRPDVIHINSSQPSIFFHQITESRYPVPALFTLHEPPTHVSGHNSLLGRMLQSAQWVTAVSRATLLQARKLVPEITTRSSVIHNALEMPALVPAPMPCDQPKLVCLGRLFEEKGFDLALDAFSMVIKRFPSARLVIAGDGPAKPELERQTAKLGLTESVEFTGWVHPEQVPGLINSATAVIVPSRWQEPFGLVALQAAQMARPVVAANVGGLPEIVIHKQTGLLVEKEDSAALAEQIIFLLLEPQAAAEMGKAARQKTQEAFSMDRMLKEYDALYHKLNHMKIDPGVMEQR